MFNINNLIGISVIFLSTVFAVNGALADNVNNALADNNEMRDPTTPIGQKAQIQGGTSISQGYELHSILISATRKLAIINGQTLREGQTISGSGGVQVKHIMAERVVLQQANKRWELYLAPTTIRKH